MQTLNLFILTVALFVIAMATLINSETACAVMAAAGVLTIAVHDYSGRRVVSRLAV
jgi:hypothetical protein